MTEPVREASSAAAESDQADGESVAIDVTVRGRVQGVGFRWFVSRTASRLELSGWVANRPDGSVQLVAEGPSEAIESLVSAVERGPAGASVDKVDVARHPASGRFSGFEIRSGSHPGD